MKKKMIFFLGLLVVTVGLFAQTEADFNVTFTQDGEGVVITGYTGTAAAVRIPATIQGMPVREIGEEAFSWKNITSVVIPEGVIVIRKGAFAQYGGRDKLVQVTLPSTLRIIEESAFSSNTGLKSIVIPNRVTEIGRNAFQWCSSLASVTLPQSLEKLGAGAFFAAGITSTITLPPKLTMIEGGAFAGCKMTSVVIPEGVIEIGYADQLGGAFRDCTALTSVTLPSTIKKIGGSAFANCSSLVTVTIPASVEVIDIANSAFSNCGKLNLASQARLKKITTAYEVEQAKQREAEQAQRQREAEERSAQENREREEREAQRQREAEEREAQAKREWEERQAQAQREQAQRQREAELAQKQLETEQAARMAEIEKIQRTAEAAQALITRLTPIYNVAYGRDKPTGRQFNEFIAIYPDYIAAKKNYDSLGLTSGHPSYNSLEFIYKTLGDYVGMIIRALDNSQKKQFDAKFK